MEQDEEHQLLRPTPGPLESATIGRVMATLLNAKPKKLQDAISRLHTPPRIAPPTVSLEQSLWFLHKYIAETVEKGEHLDQVLVPVVQHSSTMRASRQALVLLNWLFQDEVLSQNIAKDLMAIILRRDDHHVALGWCILGRSLIEYQDTANNVSLNAIREKNDVLLKMLCPCITHLTSLVCSGSRFQEGFELPTRLAVAAADLVLCITVALTRNDLDNKPKSSSINAKNKPINLLPEATKPKDERTMGKSSESSRLEFQVLLWNNLSELITLVEKLTAWSRKSRSLHAKGLERVLKWLQEVHQLYGCFHGETELQMMKTGSLILSSCWKHYGMLMRLEDHRFSKELLGQYLSGIQFYADNQVGEPNMSKDKSETINFFLNCLLLLLGRLDNMLFRNAIAEFGSQISQILLSQLQCADEEVIEGAISIFKAAIFKTNHTLSKRSIDDVGEMDDLMPTLLSFLDEQDAASKAIVKLVAEYCSICSDIKYVSKVLKPTGTKNVSQRRNAVAFVAELIHLSRDSVDALPQETWQDIANHLLECLEDEDMVIQKQAASLVIKIEPRLVLHGLVDLAYSTNGRVQTSASNTLTALLVNHKHKAELLCMLLDCISKLSQTLDSGTPMDRQRELRYDADRLLKLLPEWAKHVEDWHVMVGPLIDKMLAEPSNAIVVRFLSHISEYLAEAVDVIFQRLIFYMRQQEETDSNSETLKHESSLFSHLCPLLVIRLLPLRVFDDLTSTVVYGEFVKNSAAYDRHFSMENSDCIASLMMNRALSKSEFEDVRKLAAELCGRFHPKVLIPVLSSQLESAVNANDVLKIKVCLFSFCTSLMVRGFEAYTHPDVFRIRESIQKILSWTSANTEVSKAQHGCIDCLALLLCTELQALESSKVSSVSKCSLLVYVINQLTGNAQSSKSNGGNEIAETTSHVSFRLCMANVLISACQKISDNAKKSFVRKIVPPVVQLLGALVEPEIRAACIQVLFTVAYHLKVFIAPYSNDLLRITLKSLREGSHKEKIGGAKLLTCLMASEEEDVLEDISGGLLEARQLLQNLSSTDSSPELRHLCQQLLVCFTHN